MELCYLSPNLAGASQANGVVSILNSDSLMFIWVKVNFIKSYSKVFITRFELFAFNIEILNFVTLSWSSTWKGLYSGEQWLPVFVFVIMVYWVTLVWVYRSRAQASIVGSDLILSAVRKFREGVLVESKGECVNLILIDTKTVQISVCTE